MAETDAAEVIRQLRRRVPGLKQWALARMCGVHQSTISRVERGRPLDRNLAHTALEGLGAWDHAPLSPQSPPSQQRDPVWKPLASADTDTVGWLSSELQRLERDYDVLPSASVLAEAGQLHGALIRTSTRSASQLHMLLGLRGRSALLMGQLVWDASHRKDGSTAAMYLNEAVLAAQESRDRTVAAKALLRRAFIPLYSSGGDLHEALASAQRASHAAEGHPATQASVALHISEAHARMGNRAEAEHHLDAADTYAQQADLDTDEWSGRRLRMAGSIYLALNCPDRAQTLLEQAVPLLHGRVKSQAIVVANLALAHIRQRRPDHAVQSLQQALGMVETTWAGGALPLVATASRELRPWRREPWVADIHDRLFTFLAS
ncbi:helix-turn-helix domain-containing protein [Nocardiopsis alborubida]|uniref:Helix-turn-helix domain-containing protein n=1 Tax=Nocardiopsis alborubida TaxID=146802 RepID=A0A7X6M9N8_9ACTN|nr:helix-turn-helix domain-containing protein [Nocardiopsis alborubida]NKY96737.1 helix-turn-helix domain-containing protein [Nocardiopsis alborubida]